MFLLKKYIRSMWLVRHRIQPSDISRELMVTLGTVTTSLNNLERKGYIERRRSEVDRRVCNLSLTKNGRLLYRLHQQFHKRMVNQIVEYMSPWREEWMQKDCKICIVSWRKLNNGLCLKLVKFAHYAPDQVVSNDVLAEIMDTNWWMDQ